MPRKSSNAPASADKPKVVPQKELLLDPLNPRLAEIGLEEGETQKGILRALWENMAVDEVADSIAANGYYPHEPLFVENKSGDLVVIEGNRRLAAVRLLLDDKLRREFRATDLPEIAPERARGLQKLPVIECKREAIWPYLGFKHVNGPQPWGSSSKAKYIARLHNDLNIPLEKIAENIGDRHVTVKRLYRGLMVLEQAEEEGVFDRMDRQKKRFSFSHLYTGLDYSGFQKFLGLAPEKGFKPKPVPKKKIKNLGELCEWLYGSKSKEKQPVIKTQNPDLRHLDEVLKSENGIAALRQSLPLLTSVDISRGDERLFREALVSTKQSLESARGKLLTGYAGETDLLRTAESIAIIIDNVYEEMQRIHSAIRKSSKRKH